MHGSKRGWGGACVCPLGRGAGQLQHPGQPNASRGGRRACCSAPATRRHLSHATHAPASLACPALLSAPCPPCRCCRPFPQMMAVTWASWPQALVTHTHTPASQSFRGAPWPPPPPPPLPALRPRCPPRPTSSGVPLKSAVMPSAARSRPSPLPRGKRKHEGLWRGRESRWAKAKAGSLLTGPGLGARHARPLSTLCLPHLGSAVPNHTSPLNTCGHPTMQAPTPRTLPPISLPLLGPPSPAPASARAPPVVNGGCCGDHVDELGLVRGCHDHHVGQAGLQRHRGRGSRGAQERGARGVGEVRVGPDPHFLQQNGGAARELPAQQPPAPAALPPGAALSGTTTHTQNIAAAAGQAILQCFFPLALAPSP